MKVTFCSNYFNHHQKPLSDEFDNLTDHNYMFVATENMELDRKELGWQTDQQERYVTDAGDDAVTLCLQNSDAVIAGSAPENLLRQCIKSGKLLFRYSERPLKRGIEPLKYLPRLVIWHRRNPPRKPIYLLCASAYAVEDYRRFGLFQNRAYKWGYFPETKQYTDLEQFFNRKDPTQILWAGRFLDWKHPDDALEVAKRLKLAGYHFYLNFIGTGDMERTLQQKMSEYQLTDCVTFLGVMKPEQVREYMERAGIYLFTSDRYEGWGAVLNESMNSGCAVVASHTIGSVPYLIQDGKNGLVYRSGDVDMLYEKVRYLLEHQKEQQRFGLAAYHTITEKWNAKVSAERFIRLARTILDGNPSPDLFDDGPCSRAEFVREDWYKA